MINKENTEIILTLACPDTSGIVAEVAGFMAEQGLTIKESNQFGDIDTNMFFMRVCATNIDNKQISIDNLISIHSLFILNHLTRWVRKLQKM